MNRYAGLSDAQLDDILDIIRCTHGYDFTDYARTSLQRRIMRFMHDMGIQSPFDLKHYLVNIDGAIDLFLEKLTVNVTEMFRDPDFYRVIRNNVLPMLSSYPFIKIWHAGCSSGEEVFSMAILVHEAGLSARTRIYATDINPMNIEKAKRGILPLDVMKDYTGNYIKSGGQQDFSGYYTARYQHAIIHKDLRSNILFSQHNLVTDQVFNEFQMIFCRNVMIYFNRQLQNRVVHLFRESLTPLGYLALGSKETLLFTSAKNHFEEIDRKQKVYRRIN